MGAMSIVSAAMNGVEREPLRRSSDFTEGGILREAVIFGEARRAEGGPT